MTRHLKSLSAIVALCVIAAAANANGIAKDMRLSDAIQAARAGGLEVVYSSQKVRSWMRVQKAPSSDEPLSALREALREFDLDLRAGPGGRWLVVDMDPNTRSAVEPPSVDSGPVYVAPTLDEISVISSRYSLYSRDGSSEQFLSGDEIRLMPHFADDAFRAFHRLPGAAANDFQAPFNLRGGAVDEVKVVLDGLELFEPYHMRTLFSPLSIIDPGIVGDAQVLSGGFTAEYGNHMSGVIDMTTRQPESESTHEVGVSFVNAFARTSGSFASGKGQYLVSARRGYLDLLAEAIVDEDEELTPRFSDIFAHASYSLSDSLDISANVLFAADDVKFINQSEGENVGEDSKLGYAWLTLEAAPSDRLTITNVLFTGTVDTDEKGESIDLPLERVVRLFERDIDVSGLRTDTVWKVGERSLWKIGGRYRELRAQFDYDLDSLRQTDLTNNGVPFTLLRNIDTLREGEDIGVYAAFRFQPFDNFTGEIGARWDKQTYSDIADDTQTSPRINAFYQLGKRTELRAGWGRFYQPQGIQDLQVADGLTNYFPAQKAEHRTIGVTHRYASGLDLQLDIYVKEYSDLQPRFENALDSFQFAAESSFDRIRVDAESARSRGIELTLHDRQSSKLDWWVNFTWSEAEDRIDGRNVPRRWDQRFASTGNLTWHMENWTLNATARFHSGWPRTQLEVTPAFDDTGRFIGAESDLSNLNAEYYDDYFRIDVRLSRSVELSNSNVEFYVEVFNLLDTENRCCVTGHNLQLSPSVTTTPNFGDQLPFFPSFGFVWTFGPGAK